MERNISPRKCIHCDQCSHRTHKNGSVTYFHSAILPVIVAPGNEQVISLAPEFIRTQDGHHKQDCSQAAAKRWLLRHATLFQGTGVTVLGDDLYSRQPMCEWATQQGFHYLFVCLPESHPALSEWLTYHRTHRGSAVQPTATASGSGKVSFYLSLG